MCENFEALSKFFLFHQRMHYIFVLMIMTLAKINKTMVVKPKHEGAILVYILM